MQTDRPSTLSIAGLLLFVGFLTGAGVGIVIGEPSRGAILGVGIAGAIALLLYLAQRNRAA